MRCLYLLLVFLLLSVVTTFAQVSRKVLPRSVNIMNKDNFAPSLSADGQSMVYTSTYSADGSPSLKYTYKTAGNAWTVPEEVTEVNKYLDLNFIGGYCLSADGKTIYFTTKRGQGIGQYDILYTERQGGYWTPAKNIGKPVNSTGNDGAPSISPDGQYLYFMRCSYMSKDEAKGCEIWVAKRRNKTLWEKPVKLPSPINTGNDLFPKIFPDNHTMVFSSSRAGGKGGLDFYFSRKEGSHWSKPKPMTFLNTGLNEMFVSLTAKGNEIYFSTDYRGKENIIISRLPEEFQGDKIVLMQGVVVDGRSEDALDAFVQVYNTETLERVMYSRTEGDGSFYAVFPVGEAYDFSIQSLQKGYQYNSRLYFKDSLDGAVREKKTFYLSPIKDGLTEVNQAIHFEPFGTNISPVSKLELKRLMKMLKDNPGFNIEIGIHIDQVREDSIQSSPDLTEISIDTSYEFVAYQEFASTENVVSLPEIEDIPDNVDLDSLNNIIPETTIMQVNYTYHNDRTQLQAATLLNYFLEQGVPAHRINVIGYGDRFNIVPATGDSQSANNRVEIKYIER